MSKKTTLPLLRDAFPRAEASREGASKPRKKPSIDDARARLGGRTNGDQPALPGLVPGAVVAIATRRGREGEGEGEHEAAFTVAVVVHANAKEAHVLVDGVRLRRVSPAALTLHDGAPPDELARIAADARLFSALVEGQAVRYADDTGELLAGKLVERCRYGALVLRDDGAVIAVGFRKLWPATAHGAA